MANKKIVVYCNGTGNEYGDYNAKLLKPYFTLSKDDYTQIRFNAPGVGA